MNEYHKIQTVFKRDEKGRILEGQWTLPEFEYLKENLWVFTEKVDGTNIRIMWDGAQLTFGGKTDAAQIPATLFKRLNELFLPQAEKFKEHFPEGVCLYGEGYGAKIQKGGDNYKADGQDFVLFDVKVGRWWLERDAVNGIAHSFGISFVPIIGIGTLTQAIAAVRSGIRSKWGIFEAEGMVARPAVELVTRAGGRVITKIKTRDFNGGQGAIHG